MAGGVDIRDFQDPAGVVFPVSAAILERFDEYRLTLEDYSRRLLPVIEWAPTLDGNVEVHNDTADFYRYLTRRLMLNFFIAACSRR